MAPTPPRRKPHTQPKVPATHRAPTYNPAGSKFAPFGGMPGALRPPSAPQVAFSPTASTSGGVSMGAQATGPTAPDIRDPEYWLNMENIANYYGTSKAQYGEQRRQDEVARDRAYELLGLGRSGSDTLDPNKLYDAGGLKHEGTYYNDVSSARTSANKAGLYYSGILGQNLGDIQSAAIRKQGDIGEEFTGRENLRKIAEQGLATDYGPGGIQERTAKQTAGDRAIAAAAANPPAPIVQTAAQYLAQRATPNTAKSVAAAIKKRGGTRRLRI